jgi:hypothetical protein
MARNLVRTRNRPSGASPYLESSRNPVVRSSGGLGKTPDRTPPDACPTCRQPQHGQPKTPSHRRLCGHRGCENASTRAYLPDGLRRKRAQFRCDRHWLNAGVRGVVTL